jgi:quercetin dioxygenase-like cupin family protein
VAPPGDEVPVVLRPSDGNLLTNHTGTFTSRALFPVKERRQVEFYELRLKTGGKEAAAPHPPGTIENLVVAAGAVEIDINGTPHRLEAGDAIMFGADVAHSYTNVAAVEAVMYLVITYANSPVQPTRHL